MPFFSLHGDRESCFGRQWPIWFDPRGSGRLECVISGFRRATAGRELGWSAIPAIILVDLTEEEAFRAAVLENTNRRSYSDIDRAHVIWQYRQRGFGDRRIADEVMGLTERQVRNLLSLLELPRTVQAAIDDPDQHFSATHALALKRRQAKDAGLRFGRWVRIVNEEKLSVAELQRRVRAHYGPPPKKQFESLFHQEGTNPSRGEFWFAPVKIKVAELSAAQRAKLKAELQRVLEALS